MYAFLNDILYPDALVFDIGAHTGQMTDIFLSHKCRVIAVEPLHQYAQRLAKSFPAVTLVEAAISPIYLSSFDFMHAITRTVKDRPAVWGGILCTHKP